MNIYSAPSQSLATPVFATDARVTYQGIPATVISGNVPTEWASDYPLISLRLDRPAKRGYAPYLDVPATAVTAL